MHTKVKRPSHHDLHSCGPPVFCAFASSTPSISFSAAHGSCCSYIGEEINGVPTGEMSAQAFREWLLESNTSTGLDVGEVHVDQTRGVQADNSPFCCL